MPLPASCPTPPIPIPGGAGGFAKTNDNTKSTAAIVTPPKSVRKSGARRDIRQADVKRYG